MKSDNQIKGGREEFSAGGKEKVVSDKEGLQQEFLGRQEDLMES